MDGIRWSVLQKNQIFFSIDFHFFAKRRKRVEKMTHRKKNGVTERLRALNTHKVLAIAIFPIIVDFTTRRARSMHDVACGFCAQ